MKTVEFENRTVVPSKIICIGRNYVEHIHELGNEIPQSMVVFNKPNSALSGTPKGVAGYKIGDLFEGKIYCNEELLVVSKWEVKENKGVCNG